MEQKTADCLAKADRNRDLATELLTANTSTPPFDWVAVIAFYAAVHYVNAYLWERDNRYAPQDHRQRTAKLQALPVLRSIRAKYRRLNSLGYDARYAETSRLNRATAQSAVQFLRDIEAQIRPHLRAPS